MSGGNPSKPSEGCGAKGRQFCLGWCKAWVSIISLFYLGPYVISEICNQPTNKIGPSNVHQLEGSTADIQGIKT